MAHNQSYKNEEGEERGKGRNLIMTIKMMKMMSLVGDDFIGDLYADYDER
jgi:hypothetical protein